MTFDEFQGRALQLGDALVLGHCNVTLDEYQEKARSTAKYLPIGGYGFLYPMIGLVGETGEVFEKVKKIFRDKNGVMSEEDRKALLKECGDVLWYLSQLSYELGSSMEEIARINLEKLEDRRDRGVIQGSGDNR